MNKSNIPGLAMQTQLGQAVLTKEHFEEQPKEHLRVRWARLRITHGVARGLKYRNGEKVLIDVGRGSYKAEFCKHPLNKNLDCIKIDVLSKYPTYLILSTLPQQNVEFKLSHD